jgi:hypothetical protein
LTSKFRLLSEADTPTVVGKAWWNEALKLSKLGDKRRLVVGAIGAYVGLQVLIPVGIALGTGAADDDDGTRTERRRAIELQRRQGWSFGVADEAASLSFVEKTGSADPAANARLATDLAPRNPALAPLYVPTLFQALGSRPASDAVPTEDASTGFVALESVLPPIETGGMRAARAAAARFRALVGPPTSDLAVVVDLPGPAAVAFAAALADVFEPVFLFDNWPHPRGVVPAHLTLAAAVAERPRLVAAANTRPASSPAMFVVDRARLTPYVDAEDRFDNRWAARLPTADQLRALGVARVLYVIPSDAAPVDADDVVDDLVAWAGHGIDVRAVRVADFDDVTGDAALHDAFVARYGPAGATRSIPPTATSTWRPHARPTAFWSLGGAGPVPAVPPEFGQVPVVVDFNTGALRGAAMYRSGSWNRTTSYFGGG